MVLLVTSKFIGSSGVIRDQINKIRTEKVDKLSQDPWSHLSIFE